MEKIDLLLKKIEKKIEKVEDLENILKEVQIFLEGIKDEKEKMENLQKIFVFYKDKLELIDSKKNTIEQIMNIQERKNKVNKKYANYYASLKKSEDLL